MTQGPRIYNLFPLLAGPLPRWGPHLERAARMGFTCVNRTKAALVLLNLARAAPVRVRLPFGIFPGDDLRPAGAPSSLGERLSRQGRTRL